MASFHCTVTNPERQVFAGEVRSVVVPGVDGEIGILPNHAPMIGALGCGELRIDVDGREGKSYFVQDGFFHVDESLSVLAARAMPADTLDPAAEEQALRELESRRPQAAAGLEAQDAHAREVRIQQIRARLARKARGRAGA